MSDGPQKEFWEGLAGQWSEQNKDVLVGWYEQHNAFQDYETILWEGIPTGKDKLALEYGCGPGRNIIRFKDKFKRIDGCDISETIINKGIEWVGKHIPMFGSDTEFPFMWVCDGQSIQPFPDGVYDVVFSVICMQHINSRAKRLAIYKEINRVLKFGGYFTAQMGYGAGHFKSVDYMNDEEVMDRDTRVEEKDLPQLEQDLKDNGLIDFKYQIREPNHDVHPKWIWFQAKKG